MLLFSLLLFATTLSVLALAAWRGLADLDDILHVTDASASAGEPHAEG